MSNEEAAILECYRDVLRNRSLVSDSDFFGAGGTSLDAMRVLGRLRERLGVRLSVADMFEQPTPRALATFIQATSRPDPARASTSLVAFARRRREWRVLAPSQMGLHRSLAASSGLGLFNVVLILQFRGDVQPERVTEAIVVVVSRQEALRLRVDLDQPRQRSVDDPPVIAQLDARGRPALFDHLVRRERFKGFDLSNEPPVRFTMAQVSDGWNVVMAVHHIAFDGWSRHVLAGQIAQTYAALVEGVAPATSVSSGFLDAAEEQHDMLSDEMATSGIEYVSRLLSLPPARMGDASNSNDWTSVRAKSSLDPRIGRGLKSTARHANTTLFSVISAAVARVASERCRVDTVVLALQAANRGAAGNNDLVGCFANVVLVAIPATQHANKDRAAQAAQEALTAAFRHESLPLELASRTLLEQGHDLRGRLPTLALTLQPAGPSVIALPGGTLSVAYAASEQVEIDPTSFSLVLEIAETDDTLRVATTRLANAWTDAAYHEVESQLLLTLETFSL